jgi:tetratricopeptide (TPR) repeat protein
MVSFRVARLALAAAVALSALTHGTPAIAQADDVVARARALVENHDSKAAFNLLAPLEATRAGEIDFDYWLGAAALDAGQLERAVIALERVLVRNPDFDSARLELGRAYLRMGSLDLAAQEFTRLLARAPNEAGRKVLTDYLEEIARLKARQRFAVSGYLEAAVGRDTNLSNSTRDFTGAIDSGFGLPGVEPTGNSIRRLDNYLGANGGFDVLYRMSEDRSVFAAGNLRWRGYRNFNSYDFELGDVAAGYQARSGVMTYTTSAYAQAFRQDGEAQVTAGEERVTNDRNAFGANFEARRPLDAETQIAIGAAYTLFRYPTNPGQDTRQVAMALIADHQPSWWLGGTISARAFYSYDDAVRPLNAFTDTTATRHSFGLRFTTQSDQRATFNWETAFGWARRIDDDPYARASLIATGRDDTFDLFVRGSWRFAGAWSVQPYAVFVYNRSNIELYTFRKVDGGVLLRYDFR